MSGAGEDHQLTGIKHRRALEKGTAHFEGRLSVREQLGGGISVFANSVREVTLQPLSSGCGSPAGPCGAGAPSASASPPSKSKNKTTVL